MIVAFARILVVTGVLAGAAHAADFDRTLTVGGSSELTLSNGSGKVHVTPGDDSSIHIRAHVYAGWNPGGDVEERIKRIAANPPVQQSGNSVRVGGDLASDHALYQNITIDYEITAPRSVALNLHTGSGAIDVDHVGRALKGDSGSGSVRVHGLSGPAELHTGSGEIELQEQASGDVHASTGSGSIRIEGLSGGLTASTGSGNIEASGHISGQSRLKSGSGSVHLHLGPDAKLNVDASTGAGSIRIAGNSAGDRHRFNQSINGGGPLVEIQTGSGSIEIN